MNRTVSRRLARVLVPAALSLAAFGAQASELAPGDLGQSSPVGASSVERMPVAGPATGRGEVAVGDLGLSPVVRGAAPRTAPASIATPVPGPAIVGA